MRERARQAVLVLATVCFSWLAMLAIHEFGHVITAWGTGGSVRKVVLPLVGFSRTDLSDNPRPLAVAWGGAVFGALLPLALNAGLGRVSPRYAFLSRFFAGFCCIANGAYLGGGAWLAAGDAGDLIARGAHRWQLMSFGLTTVALGLWLWNGLGPNFGLRVPRGHVDEHATTIAVSVCAATIAVYAIMAVAF
jgi:hypothetical protein